LALQGQDFFPESFMFFFRILVLDRGEIKEFDSPNELLRDESSIFHSMAKDAGLV
jgi:ABC-type multidrug transport system fused ATPase/permease subunit